MDLADFGNLMDRECVGVPSKIITRGGLAGDYARTPTAHAVNGRVWTNMSAHTTPLTCIPSTSTLNAVRSRLPCDHWELVIAFLRLAASALFHFIFSTPSRCIRTEGHAAQTSSIIGFFKASPIVCSADWLQNTFSQPAMISEA